MMRRGDKDPRVGIQTGPHSPSIIIRQLADRAHAPWPVDSATIRVVSSLFSWGLLVCGRQEALFI